MENKENWKIDCFKKLIKLEEESEKEIGKTMITLNYLSYLKQIIDITLDS